LALTVLTKGQDILVPTPMAAGYLRRSVIAEGRCWTPCAAASTLVEVDVRKG
jgi:hypothetical protein